MTGLLGLVSIIITFHRSGQQGSIFISSPITTLLLLKTSLQSLQCYPPPPLENFPQFELISFITGQFLDPWKHYTTKLSNLRHGTVTLIKIRPGKIEIPPFLGWIFYSHVYCSCHKQVSLYQHSLSHCHVYSPAMGLLWVFFICWFILLRFVKILSQREQGNFLPKWSESLWACYNDMMLKYKIAR